MTALDVIRSVQLHGGELVLDGEKLRVRAPGPLPHDLMQQVREHKPAIMTALGAPMDAVIAGILAEIRPHLPTPLQPLPDDKLLALVNWSLIVAWEKAIREVPK